SDLRVILEAFREMAEKENLGRIGRLVPIELGIQSCVLPVCLMAHMLNTSGDGWNLKVLDADGAGRAVPMLSATTFATATAAGEIESFPALFGGTVAPKGDIPGGRLCIRFEGEDPTAFHLHRAAFGAVGAFSHGAAALVCWPMKSLRELNAAI